MVSKIFSQLEILAQKFQLRYMAKRRTTEVVEPGRIRFHPQDCRERVLQEYQKRLHSLGQFLGLVLGMVVMLSLTKLE